MTANYAAFLDAKLPKSVASGFDVEDSALNPQLFPFQRDIVKWAIRRGRA